MNDKSEKEYSCDKLVNGKWCSHRPGPDGAIPEWARPIGGRSWVEVMQTSPDSLSVLCLAALNSIEQKECRSQLDESVESD